MHVLYQPRPVGRRQTPEDGAAHHAPHTPHRKLVDLESGKAYTFHYQGAGADLSPPGDQQYKAPTSSASSSARGTAVGHHHRSSAARRQALWHLLLTLMACVGWVAASSLAILTNKHVMVRAQQRVVVGCAVPAECNCFTASVSLEISLRIISSAF